jgi:AcrR family transcriptional regulator
VGICPLVKTRPETLPTGVPIRDLREQLFDAAERLLVRDGPDALRSRALTTEAGLAKGILHRHFPDFDTFLAALVLARIELIEARSAELRAAAGSDEVADNLANVLADVLPPAAIRIISLSCSRHALLERLRVTTPTGIPLLAETTKMVAAYLTAERGLGRIALSADVDSLAMLLVGGAHLLATEGDGSPPHPAQLRALVGTTVNHLTPQPSSRLVQT